MNSDLETEFKIRNSILKIKRTIESIGDVCNK
jgi:hypothetical protein